MLSHVNKKPIQIILTKKSIGKKFYRIHSLDKQKSSGFLPNLNSVCITTLIYVSLSLRGKTLDFFYKKANYTMIFLKYYPELSFHYFWMNPDNVACS